MQRQEELEQLIQENSWDWNQRPVMFWEAIYDDGTEANELELKTVENIDRSRLVQFRLYDVENERLAFVVELNKNRQLIFRRRHFMSTTAHKGMVILCGWHENVKGVSVKSIAYIYADGHVEFDDARNNLQLGPKEMFDDIPVEEQQIPKNVVQ